jgi:hypothetical protein
VPGSPFASGTTPLTLATAKNFLYSATADGLTGYSIAPGSGILTPLAGSPFAIHGAPLATDPGGNLLYVSSAAGIAAFTIGGDGSLTPLTGSPFTGPEATILTFVQ